MSKKKDQHQFLWVYCIWGGIIGGLFALLIWWLLAFITDMIVRFIVFTQDLEDVLINPVLLIFCLFLFIFVGIAIKIYWDDLE